MDEKYGTQGCVDCGEWCKVPLDFSGLIRCKKCFAKSEKGGKK